MIEDLMASLAHQVTRAKNILASYSTNKARTLIQVKGFAGETLQDIELLLPYGMSAMPIGSSADYLLFQVNNTRDHTVAIGGDDPALRITDLVAGEFGFKNKFGFSIELRQDGIYLKAPNGKIVLNGQALAIHGTESLKYDADGNGTEFTAGTRDDYVTGATVTAHPLNPPQVP